MVQAKTADNCAAMKNDPITTPISPPKILLIESDPVAAREIRAALAAPGTGSFDVECVRQLSEGLERLSKKGIAAVLLALSLPDSHGIETFDKLFAAAPDVPILILGGNVPEALAKEAVGRGAQDYLLPGHLDSYSLPRALRNAIERKAVEDALYVEKERACRGRRGHRDATPKGLPSGPTMCRRTRLPLQPAPGRRPIRSITTIGHNQRRPLSSRIALHVRLWPLTAILR